ncbi:cobaltochelatase subunit CobN [Paracoccus sp. Z118]|uniref:cobaltochelatase subunit CobN n=1 Tax=Paracoccus sp. Z118 TaxID=2851017 RepID=UPI001C2C3617|nr:cobaltochelatase subunit CobN [Paracoccus sp. Z118]MBV0892723.1 cobaltochelatase subunit CobN [Paracoccus sp. Z118]
MHVLFRENHGLEETAQPQDLGQAPADLVVLSFSDSDLGAFAAGWQRGRDRLPSMRLANLSRLRHPLSVDTYVERTLSAAKGILVRLIGGRSYWPYGVDELSRIARVNGIALAVLPADGNPDPVLDAASTVPIPSLRRLSELCETGGDIAAEAALAELAVLSGLKAGVVEGITALPNHGFWHPGSGPVTAMERDDRPLILIPFYRAWAATSDTASVAALIRAFEAEGVQAVGLFLPSLKDRAAADWLRSILPDLAPAAIVNATAFSGRGEGGSPLDAPEVPVFQVIHATSDRAAWAGSERGLSAADLAMHVALPELDGRINAGVISFKEMVETDPALQFRLQRHRPDAERIGAVVARVLNWRRLQTLPPSPSRVALILSTYPGKEWRLAHAVGLDALASAAAIARQLGRDLTPETVLRDLKGTRLAWSLDAYRAALSSLPEMLRRDLEAAHGEPNSEPGIQGFWADNILLALQPERGRTESRETDYHDLSHVPGHDYAAFYLWLRHGAKVDAIIHVGAHGTLEWLPGKAAALSRDCWPDALTGSLPVLYPFIVNDPGEAAQARRRLGALTLGHLPPPLVASGMPDNLLRLESLLDEYSTADGLDPARRLRLIAFIRDEAQRQGLEADLGLAPDASAAEAITAIDRFVCDLKESQFGDGLHVWGEGTPDEEGRAQGDPASLASERASIHAALAGRHVAAGPSGSPFRGRLDVLPTGRNLYGVDPRAVPSRAAWAQGVRLAEELVRRHLQDHGDYPRGLVVNLWGSATMRTAGEDFAMALHLAGLEPLWDPTSERVTGFEITPLALMDRPRIEVTLRVSGLFRDTFPELVTLFQQGCDALAARDEPADMNPYVMAAPGSHVFAPAPGRYGTGIGDDMMTEAAGLAWLQNSAFGADGTADRQALEARIGAADGFVLSQDLPETDLLLAMDYAAHEAGFAAARTVLGLKPAALYHLDATAPDAPRARLLSEEIARVIRARAANPRWLRGMMRHGFRGAAEIAATLEHMAAFARMAQAVPQHLFALYHQATLGSPEVRDFLAEANPAALGAMETIFAEFGPALRRNSTEEFPT